MPGGPTDDDTPITVPLQYVDEAIATDTQANTGPLVIPTARDVRIRMRPFAAARSNYYGPAATVGLVSDFSMRAPATDEPALLTTTTGLEPGGRRQ